MVQRRDVPMVEVLRLTAERWAIIRSPEFRPTSNGYPPTPVEILSDRYPVKVVRARMEQLADQGFIDYGSSAEGGWLTPEGEALLREDVAP